MVDSRLIETPDSIAYRGIHRTLQTVSGAIEQLDADLQDGVSSEVREATEEFITELKTRANDLAKVLPPEWAAGL